MASKFYAVRQGRQPGVYESWEACRAQVQGFSGAIFKSFPTLIEAQQFMQDLQNSQGSQVPQVPQASQATQAQKTVSRTIEAYVDGSYNSRTKEYSYGMVVLTDGEERTFCQKFSDPAMAQMRNVAGEIRGAQAAMQYALDYGCDRLTIYHDYEGIARWCLGDWRANREGTKAYRAFYEKASERVDISFVKVAGHSNDHYNDMADALAKQALGISENRPANSKITAD